jgi:hypothetical protein
MNTITQDLPIGSAEIGAVATPASRWQRIPAEMRALPQWVLAGADKVPRKPNGGYADSTDPATWSSFDTVCQVAAQKGWDIGFVPTANDPYTCIDLDVKSAASHPDRPDKWTTSEQIERHQRIINEMASYTELSRSGLGWHVWVRGNIGAGRNRDSVEVYSQEHFLICTGNVHLDRPIEDRQSLLENMVSQMAPPAPTIVLDGPNRADEALAGRMAADHGLAGRLWRGEWAANFSSQSDADLALIKSLLPQSASPRECWATFRLSELGKRSKAGRPDYMRRTLACATHQLATSAEALRHGREVAEIFLKQFEASRAPSRLRLLVDSDLDRLPRLRWLIKGVIPDAGIGAIYGASGSYKSFLTLDLLAHISNGREWFGHRVKGAPAVYVPFEGQGGIPNRIKAWRTAQTVMRHPDRLPTSEPDADVLSRIAVVMEPLNLREEADRRALVAGLKQQGWAGGILCIDTLAHASAGIEENSSAMGEMIGIFRNLQQELGGVILLVHHSGKDESRGMRGWSGLHAAMDFVVECQKKGEASAREASFSLAKVKDGTTGTAFGFRMDLIPLGIDEDGDAITSLVVRSGQSGGEPERPFVEDAIVEVTEDDAFVESWVRELMMEGFQPTGRWLEAARVHIKDKRKLTQKRLRDAICRLKAVGRLEDAADSLVTNGKWLRAVDVPQG